MNWRRGLLLAAINVAIAAPLLSWQVANRLAALKTVSQHRASSTFQLVAFQEQDSDQTVAFDPCQMWYYIDPVEWLPSRVNLPVAIVTGWPDPCPARWMLFSILQSGQKHNTRGLYISMVAGFSILAAIQWWLVGSFPLRRPKRWWGEPGAFITACACSGGIPVLIFAAIHYWIEGNEFARTPEPISAWAALTGVLALLAWLWWLALLIWKAPRHTWRLAANS